MYRTIDGLVMVLITIKIQKSFLYLLRIFWFLYGGQYITSIKNENSFKACIHCKQRKNCTNIDYLAKVIDQI